MKSLIRSLALAASLAACSTASVPPVEAQKPAPAPALAVAPIAGQRVPVLPLTLLTADSAIEATLPPDRISRLAWADSIMAEVLMERGPEVTWVLPAELRATARRAPATVTNPDRMGHALMRAEGIEVVPDPLRAYLRSLTAMTNSRLVMIPAAVRFTTDSMGGIRAETVLVLADSRNGAVLWRSQPVASAGTAHEALRATIRHILPDYN